MLCRWAACARRKPFCGQWTTPIWPRCTPPSTQVCCSAGASWPAEAAEVHVLCQPQPALRMPRTHGRQHCFPPPTCIQRRHAPPLPSGVLLRGRAVRRAGAVSCPMLLGQPRTPAPSHLLLPAPPQVTLAGVAAWLHTVQLPCKPLCPAACCPQPRYSCALLTAVHSPPFLQLPRPLYSGGGGQEHRRRGAAGAAVPTPTWRDLPVRFRCNYRPCLGIQDQRCCGPCCACASRAPAQPLLPQPTSS